MANATNLFPKIGDIASSADNIEHKHETEVDDGDEKVIQEIESLCMKCHEQVSTYTCDIAQVR